MVSFISRHIRFQESIPFRNHPFQELSFSGIILFRECLFDEFFSPEFRVFLQAACQEEMIAIEMIALDHNICCVIVLCNGSNEIYHCITYLEGKHKMIEGSLEVKLPTIWTVEKQR